MQSEVEMEETNPHERASTNLKLEVAGEDIDYYMDKMRMEGTAIPSRMWAMSSRNSRLLLELILASLILGLKKAFDNDEKDDKKKTANHIPSCFYHFLVDVYSSYMIFYMYNSTFRIEDDLRELRGVATLCVSMLMEQDGQKWDENDEVDLEEVLEKIFISGGLTHFFARDQKMSSLKIDNANKFKGFI